MNIRFNQKVFCSLFFLALCFAVSAFSQSDPKGERRVTGTYALTNATVITSPGKSISGATVLIKNGLIEGIGSDIKIPSEAQVITMDSLFIYPGFIDGAGNTGINKPAEPERPANFDPSYPPDEIAGITPWRNVLDYFDSKSTQVQDWRKVGFTVSQIIPDGGMLPGKSSIVTFGGKESSNILAQNTSLHARFRSSGGGRGMYPGTQMGMMAKFRDLYKNAELSEKHHTLFASTSGISRPEVNKTLEAFFPVLNKKIPITFEVSNDLEIRRVLSLKNENGFRLILVNVADVEHVIKEIKEANAQVLLGLKLPNDKTASTNLEDLSDEMKARTQKIKDAYQKVLKQASSLESAGIPFGFTTIGANPNEMYKNIRLMIQNGLSEDAALAALTINTANILGIQRFTGTIEKGKLANMVIMTGPIFTEESQVKHVIADGYIFDYELKKKSGNGGAGENGKAPNIVGIWEYTSDTPAGSSGGIMEIKKEGEHLKGVISYDDPAGNGKATSEMKNISLSGSNLTFTFNVAAAGMSLEVSVNGDVNANQFSGNMSLTEYGSFPLNATKRPNQSNQ
ncbi:amidohydrolase family protein [Shivajiella indica]|uniref:Amidohydrolase family protein n=1 Tax=Shivajiella indica TaxID=872115 RepID=A0ABW5BA11_9BACT